MIVTVDALAFGFTPDQRIFAEFNWQIAPGERWAVLGPSGCGKSTLLLLLAGILKPNAGAVTIAGQAITRPRPRTGLILQNYGLLPWATVQQNVELGLTLRSFYGPDGTHAPNIEETQSGKILAEHWINRLGLNEITNRFPAQISGGQQQRTAIARTLTLSPDLLLMDEPFGSLDAPTSETLQDQIINLQIEENLALVIVTHSVETAAYMGEKILVLSNTPNTSTKIINNPNSGSESYRQSEEYQQVCETLRANLETIL